MGMGIGIVSGLFSSISNFYVRITDNSVGHKMLDVYDEVKWQVVKLKTYLRPEMGVLVVFNTTGKDIRVHRSDGVVHDLAKDQAWVVQEPNREPVHGGLICMAELAVPDKKKVLMFSSVVRTKYDNVRVRCLYVSLVPAKNADVTGGLVQENISKLVGKAVGV